MTETPNLPAVIPQPKPPAPVGRRRPAPVLASGEKAAIVLASLGPGPSAPILNGVGPERVHKFAKILSRLRPAPREMVDNVLEEFLAKMEGDQPIAGGADRARNFLAEVLGPAELEQTMADLGGTSPSVWRNFAQLPEAEILGWLEAEDPNVAALALTQMPSETAAKLLGLLPPDTSRLLVELMERGAQASPALIGRIAEAIETGFLPAARLRARGVDPAGLIASVMNHVAPALRDEIIAHLRDSKPVLAADVERIMFTFENIPERINPRDVPLILRQVDEALLLIALRLEDEAGSAAQEFILSNVATRLAERLRQDLADMQPPSQKDCDAARATVVAAITGARDRGEIEMVEQEDED